MHSHSHFIPATVQSSSTINKKGKPSFFLSFPSRLSGFMLPSPIVSSGSILALWFTTDFAVSAQGFKAVYEGKMTGDGVAGPSDFKCSRKQNRPACRTCEKQLKLHPSASLTCPRSAPLAPTFSSSSACFASECEN